MDTSRFRIPRFVWTFGWIVAGLLICFGGLWFTQSYWKPWAVSAGILAGNEQSEEAGHGHAHGASAGSSASGSATDTIMLSEQAKKNIGLKTGPVQLAEYEETVSIPGMVTERPGRTDHEVAALLSGFVEDVFAIPGQAVDPGTPLFVLRLTNEELVTAQSNFLNTLLALDVEEREIARLESITEGAIAQKVILERKYERDKLEGQRLAQRQALLLHGLSERQIDSIAEEHRLLREFLISAPHPHDESEPGHLESAHPRLASSISKNPAATSPGVEDVEHAFVVEKLPVKKGQRIQAGDPLVTLANLSRLYIQGDAFERDAPALVRANENDWKVSAVLEQDGKQIVEGLDIAYVANEIDRQSRTLRFFVDLPNEIVNKSQRPGDRIFPTWRFKPGQRVELRVPVNRWQDQLVLPVEAVVKDGPEQYLFVQSGNTFRRQPVHVIRRGADEIAIHNDGSIYPGTHVALNAAHQLQMALKNQAGGSAAGHGHMH